jgi:hypothetical protein
MRRAAKRSTTSRFSPGRADRFGAAEEFEEDDVRYGESAGHSKLNDVCPPRYRPRHRSHAPALPLLPADHSPHELVTQ